MMIVKTLGDDSPCYSTVKKWVVDFKRDRESIDNDKRIGRPKSATTCARGWGGGGIHRMVMNDRRVNAKHIVENMGIIVGSVHIALTEILGISKQSARWMIRILTPDQKLNALEISRTLLARFHSGPVNFLKRIVTQDETCVHHFEKAM